MTSGATSIALGERALSAWDVADIVAGRLGLGAPTVLVRQRNERARQALLDLLARDGVVYGVTTGFGDSCEVKVQGDLVSELPKNLFRFHGCGVGENFESR